MQQVAEVVPEFITPSNVADLDDDRLDTLINRVREDRLRAYYIFLEAEKMKMEVRQEKLRKKLDQHARMLSKEITQCDRVIEKLNKRVNNIRAIKLEIGEL